MDFSHKVYYRVSICAVGSSVHPRLQITHHQCHRPEISSSRVCSQVSRLQVGQWDITQLIGRNSGKTTTVASHSSAPTSPPPSASHTAHTTAREYTSPPAGKPDTPSGQPQPPSYPTTLTASCLLHTPHRTQRIDTHRTAVDISEDFTARFVRAIQHQPCPSFRRRLPTRLANLRHATASSHGTLSGTPIVPYRCRASYLPVGVGCLGAPQTHPVNGGPVLGFQLSAYP